MAQILLSALRRSRVVTARLVAALALAAVLIPTTGAPVGVAQARDAGQSIANSDRGVVPDIFATGNSTCATMATGQLSCWGANEFGQLGNGTTLGRNTPSPPIALPGGTTALKVTGSTTDTCALLNTGQITCWGRNESSEHGNGTTDSSLTPTAPVAFPSGITATDITLTNDSVCALLNTAQVSCWGRNGNGQLGTGDNTQRTAPPAAPINLPGAARSIASGSSHACALLTTGQISCWGRDSEGQLGTAGPNGNRNTPSPTITLPGGSAARSIAADKRTTCAILATGQATCWGDNQFGQLGAGDTTDRSTPPPPITFPGNATASAIEIGSRHVCALLTTGNITCWGANYSGQLGNGTVGGPDQTAPSGTVTLPAGTHAVSISVGGSHTCALLNTGDFTCWGRGGNGRLGNGDDVDQNSPTPATALPAIDPARRTVAIATGTHSCALLDTGDVTCWGYGGDGQLGTGNTDDRTTPSNPIALPTGATATAIASGLRHTCAILSTGEVSCWGNGGSGRLGTGGTGSLNAPSAPIALPPGTTATALALGESHTCALLNTGEVSCWGRGANGQLGTGNTADRNTPSPPIALPGGTTATAIGAGEDHTCAVLSTGEVSCWGLGNGGQLGNGTNANAQTTPTPPISLPGGTAAIGVVGGNLHTCALLDRGQVSCWGNNTFGYLGTGDNANRNTPSPPINLPAGTTATGLSTGRAHVCAILTTGGVSCWGLGATGRLGTGNSADRNTPSPPLALPADTTATALDVGTDHACAVLNTGQISCWGFGNSGRLGTGNTATQSSPVLVTFPQAAPTAALAAGQATPTNDTTIDVTVTFDEPVTGFDVDDVALGGTAGATTAAITGTGDTYQAAVTGMANDGTVTIAVPTGDLSAFGNTASNTLTIDYDTTGPIATIDHGPGQAASVTATPVSFSVIFDEAVTGLDATDITIAGTAGTTTGTIAGSGSAYTVTIDTVPNPGTITLALTDGAVADSLGNLSTSATTNDTIAVNDTTGPIIDVPADITVQAAPGIATAEVVFTATASDPNSDASTTNGIARFGGTITPTCIPASGSQFPIGTTTVDCTATDAANNTTAAAFLVTVEAQAASTTAPPVTTTTTVTTSTSTSTTVTPTTEARPDIDVELPATGSNATHTGLWLAAILVAAGVVVTLASRRRWN